MDVLLVTLTLVAATPPKLTLAPAANPLPLMVTSVPPAVVPEFGDIALTVGDVEGEVPVFGRMVVSFFSAPGEDPK